MIPANGHFLLNTSTTVLRAYILCRFAAKSPLYTSWIDRCPLPVTIVKENLYNWELPADAGLVVTHMHYRHEELAKLREIHERGTVPVLVLADGILEYRNTWEHPELPDASMFQPLCGHKLACIGRGQVRVIESWGNVGKCEFVGLPRMDPLLKKEVPPIQTDGPFRLLIATANTPSFNDQQRETVVQSLTHIRERLEKNPKVNGRQCVVTWRLTDGLERAIGLPESEIPSDEPDAPKQKPLLDVINEVDAVITTPSTLYLESVIKKRPTAILDFHNRPHYVPAAWTINAPIHFNWTLRELADPPAHKMLFQDATLLDQLECQGSATDRMIELMETMIESGRTARADGESIKLPHRIIADARRGFGKVPATFNLEKLYPDNEVFKNQDLRRLQVELVAAIERLDTLPTELIEKNGLIDHLIVSLDGARLRANRMKNRVIAIRKRLGIKPDPKRKKDA